MTETIPKLYKSLNYLTSVRTVIIDDNFNELTRYSKALWNAGNTCCIPVYAIHDIPMFQRDRTLTLEDKIIAEECSRQLHYAFEDASSWMSNEERTICEKRIVSIHVSKIVDTCQVYKPDLIIIDTEMGSARGYDRVSLLKIKLPGVKIIGTSGNSEYKQEWREVGADAFFYKERNTQEIVTLVDQVLQGDLKVRETLFP